MWTQSLIYPLHKGRRCRGHPEGPCRHLFTWEENALLQENGSLLPGRLSTNFARFQQRVRVGISCGSPYARSASEKRAPPRTLSFKCLYFNVFLICQTSVWVLALSTMSPWSNYWNCLNSLVLKKVGGTKLKSVIYRIRKFLIIITGTILLRFPPTEFS